MTISVSETGKSVLKDRDEIPVAAGEFSAGIICIDVQMNISEPRGKARSFRIEGGRFTCREVMKDSAFGSAVRIGRPSPFLFRAY